MKDNYLFEAFKALNDLNEDVFNIGDTFDDTITDETTVDVIDPNATTEDEVKDSYIGMIICKCPVCQSLLYKTKDELVVDEDVNLANVDEECPYCYVDGGFEVVGKVVPYADDDAEDEVTTEDETTDETTEDESIDDEETTDTEEETTDESLEESVNDKDTVGKRVRDNRDKFDKCVSKEEIINVFKDITSDIADRQYTKKVIYDLEKKKDLTKALSFIYDIILAGDGLKSIDSKKNESLEESVTVNVSGTDDVDVNVSGTDDVVSDELEGVESVGVEGDEVIAPVEATDLNDIVNNDTEDNDENALTDIEASDDEDDVDEIDVDFEDVDKDGKAFESYLVNKYENVKKFKLTESVITNDYIDVSGRILFDDKTVGNVKFRLKPQTVCNENLSFSAICPRISNKKMIVEGYVKNNRLVINNVR